MTRRILLAVLLVWALAMIVPDLARLVRPLGSFGFYANNDGLIYDVTGPFSDQTASPAWKAGIREGDRLDLSRMRCLPCDAVTCGSVLAALGGLQFVMPGRSATLDIAATPGRAARQVALIAEQRPVDWIVRAVLILDQIAGILVVLAAAWLVWTRPGGMSWGFFLYVMWFNPGQSFVYYALLQQWPALLLAQNVAGCGAQAAGYAGLLLFAIRVPTDQTTPDWRALEHSLPLVALFLTLSLIASCGGLFGYQTEATTRAAILIGFVIALCALIILMVRRRTQTPEHVRPFAYDAIGAVAGLDDIDVLETRPVPFNLLVRVEELFLAPWLHAHAYCVECRHACTSVPNSSSTYTVANRSSQHDRGHPKETPRDAVFLRALGSRERERRSGSS